MLIAALKIKFIVLFIKIAAMYFIRKIYIYILAVEKASRMNQHCANCIACWSGSRVPRRRLSPSVGRWSSPTALQLQ